MGPHVEHTLRVGKEIMLSVGYVNLLAKANGTLSRWDVLMRERDEVDKEGDITVSYSPTRAISSLLVLMRTYTYSREAEEFRNAVLEDFINLKPDEWNNILADLHEHIPTIGKEATIRENDEWVNKLRLLYEFRPQ